MTYHKFLEIEFGTVWEIKAKSLVQAWRRLVKEYEASLNEGKQSHEEAYIADVPEMKWRFNYLGVEQTKVTKE